MAQNGHKPVKAFVLGSIISPVVLWAVKRSLTDSVKATIMPVVTPMARDAAKKVIGAGLQVRQILAEAAEEAAAAAAAAPESESE